MDKLEVAAKVSAMIFGAGAGFVAKNVLANNLDEPENLKQKVQIVAGTLVIGGMVGKQAKLYTTETIAHGIEQYNEFKTKLEAKKAESEGSGA